MGPRRLALEHVKIEAVRVRAEQTLYDAAMALPDVRAAAKRVSAASPREIGAELLRSATLLTDYSAPDACAAAREAIATLGIAKDVELWSVRAAANDHNFGTMLAIRDRIVILLVGRVLRLVDPETLRAAIGHELGHQLLHCASPEQMSTWRACLAIAQSAHAARAARRLCRCALQASELSADRFELLVAQDVAVALRLNAVLSTGLPSPGPGWNVDAYLEGCRAQIEASLDVGDVRTGISHPDDVVRAYATWLFNESDLYRRLTGRGTARLSIDEVDRVIERVLGVNEAVRDARALATWEPRDTTPEALGEAAANAITRLGAAVATFAHRVTRAGSSEAARSIVLEDRADESSADGVDAEELELLRRFEELERRPRLCAAGIRVAGKRS